MSDFYRTDYTDLVYRMRLEFGVGLSLATRSRVESDPATWPMPVRLVRRRRDAPRVLWQVVVDHARRSWQIIGYERRKASGSLRYHADPRSLAVITGVTS